MKLEEQRKNAESQVFSEARSMQVYTSPVPAYLLSALPPHLPSIHIPHLWAHTLLSLFHFSVRNRRQQFELLWTTCYVILKEKQ